MCSVSFLFALSALLAPMNPPAAGIEEIVRLTPPDGAIADEFGQGVAVWGDTVVVGSPRHDAAGAQAGAVYVFERDLGGPNAWGLAEKLLPPVLLTSGDQLFGQAVALDGDTLAVGMPWLDGGDGAVFVYEREASGFALVAVNLGELDDLLGWSLDLEGDTLVAGAPDSCSPDFSSCIQAEKAVVYGRDQGGPGAWGELQVLPSQTGYCDGLGEDVDLDGDALIVGAPVLDYYCQTSNPGSAHVYYRDPPGVGTFSWETELAPGADQDANSFGKQVALDGERAAFSGQRGDELDGEVQIWERSPPGGPWQVAVRIRGPIESGVPSFGDSLFLRNDLLLVGHPASDASPEEPGRVWIYRRAPSGIWSFRAWLYPIDPQPDDRFGQSMSLSGSLLVVGAPSSYPTSPGAVHVFVIGSNDPQWQGVLPGTPLGG